MKAYRAEANKYADMIIKEKKTIREVAKVFGVSKSKVHKYITHYATGCIRKLKLRIQLDKNFDIKHIRGGNSTKEKWRRFRLKKAETNS